jgi:hypothetical protein
MPLLSLLTGEKGGGEGRGELQQQSSRLEDNEEEDGRGGYKRDNSMI